MSDFLEPDERMRKVDLRLHSVPVNKTAARVAFFRGDHFYALRHERGRRQTWWAPPKPVGPRPETSVDYSGLRHDSVIALYWLSRSRKGRDVWVVKCDCGSFEIREPMKWLRSGDSARGEPDRCEWCRDRLIALRGPLSSRDRKAERQQAWVARMLKLGLTLEEVAAIWRSRGGIDTQDVPLQEIRAAVQRFIKSEEDDSRPASVNDGSISQLHNGHVQKWCRWRRFLADRGRRLLAMAFWAAWHDEEAAAGGGCGDIE